MKYLLIILLTTFSLSNLLSQIESEDTPRRCNDGIDNDNDGFIDCDDPDCFLNLFRQCENCSHEGVSFGDVVLDWDITCTTTNEFTDPAEAIGPNNFSGLTADGGFVSLGSGGYITIGFLDNLLTNSGDRVLDLWVFEIGQQVENTLVYARPFDQNTIDILELQGIEKEDDFYLLGELKGSTSALDIDDIIVGLPKESIFFDAVKVYDIPPSFCVNKSPGADIDAICAISSTPTVIAENCFDGTDNTNDNLTDLNDMDCNCETPLELSLIPNPSVENMYCCPYEQELDCAMAWDEISAGVIHYYHNCGGLVHAQYGFTPPIPFPEGSGVLGLGDGIPDAPLYKGYAATCLFSPLERANQYRIDLSVGFLEKTYEQDFELTFYASKNCDDNAVVIEGDCPDAEWDPLITFEVNGNNEWKEYSFLFEVNVDYNAIAIGPSCTINPDFNNSPYFFLDKLVLVEPRVFELELEEHGSFCNSDFMLSVDNKTEELIQWFRDGVALNNQRQDTLRIDRVNFESGLYQAMVYSPDYCILSKELFVDIPGVDRVIIDSTCVNEPYDFYGDPVFASAFIPRSEIKIVSTPNSCDSLIQLELTSRKRLFGEDRTVHLCGNSSIEFEGNTYNRAGTFGQYIEAEEGCDTFYLVKVLDGTPQINIDTMMCPGERLFIDFEILDVGTYSYTKESAECDTLIILNVSRSSFCGEACGSAYDVSQRAIIKITMLDNNLYTLSSSIAHLFNTDSSSLSFDEVSFMLTAILIDDVLGNKLSSRRSKLYLPQRKGASDIKVFVKNIYTAWGVVLSQKEEVQLINQIKSRLDDVKRLNVSNKITIYL